MNPRDVTRKNAEKIEVKHTQNGTRVQWKMTIICTNIINKPNPYQLYVKTNWRTVK
jgi:hypothetical protein